MIRIVKLADVPFDETSLSRFDRRQQVTRQYRMVDGRPRLVEQPYLMNWDAEGKREIARELMQEDRITHLALDGDEIAGFVCLNRALCGRRMILELIQVSRAYRGKGLGRRLFALAVENARQAGAAELYISACPSEETIAFYRAMGAEVTDDAIPERAEAEPFDLQMTCPI